MKYFLAAGETSGDQHGARLMAALKRADPEADFCFVGGDAMVAAGGTLLLHIDQLSVMGIWEVVKKIPSLLRNMRLIKNGIRQYAPDRVIFIDFSGMNLRLASWTKKQGFYNVFYILPKAWAWGKHRIRTMKKTIDLPLSILPFETDYFKRHGLDVCYVGNPSVESVNLFEPQKSHWPKDHRKIVAVLPGSRIQEVTRILPEVLDAMAGLPNVRPIISVAHKEVETAIDATNRAYNYEKTNDFYQLLYECDAVVAASGTATLEAALFDKPQLVVYKTSFITYALARSLMNLEYISLVNLIAGERLVNELIQQKCSTEEIARETQKLLSGEKIIDYTGLKAALQQKTASENASDAVIGKTFLI